MNNASIRDSISHLQLSNCQVNVNNSLRKKSRAKSQQEILQSYGLLDKSSADSCQAQKDTVKDQNKELAQNSHQVHREPSDSEIRLEIEKLKSAGLMTEISKGTNFVSSAQSISSPAFQQTSSKRPNFMAATPSDLGASRAPYWIVASLACCWLVYSMTTSLPGHWFWNLLIAVAFEFTPMLILGARVNQSVQKTALWGALAIFLIGLGLYLAPSIQMLINESSAYIEASDRYAGEMKDYHSTAANSRALVETAKADADRSAQSYEDALKSYGKASWRTAAEKKQKISDAAEWKRQSSDTEIAKAPIPPKISDDLTRAAQAIATRIGLFAVVFLSMFVMRRLEGPETT